MVSALNKQVFYNLIFFFFNQGSTFFANIVNARILGRAEYGQYVLSLNTVVAVASLAGLGMGYAATKFTAEHRDANKARAGEILGFCEVMSALAGTVGMVLLMVFARKLAVGYLASPELAQHIRVAGVLVLLSSVNAYLIGTLSGFSSFHRLAWIGIASGASYLTLSVGGARYFGIEGALLGIVVGYALQLVLLVRVTRHETNARDILITYSTVWKEGTLVKAWVVPGVLNGITAVPTLWLMQSFLIKFTRSFQDVADYNAAYSFLVLLVIVPNIINSVGIPFINNLLGNRNEQHYKRFFWTNLAITLATIAAGALVFGLLGRTLLSLYGSGFVHAYSYLQVFLIASVPESLTIAISQVLQSKGKAWLYLLGVNVPRDTTMLICAFFWVQRYGAVGLCYAYLTGRLVGMVAVSVCTMLVGLDLDGRTDAQLAAA